MEPPVEQQALGATELRVSRVCLGAAGFGTATPEHEVGALLDAFVESGGNFIDTARVYSDWIPGERGRSERILGEWLRRHSDREGLVVATKGGHPDTDAMHQPRITRRALREDLEASLERLGVERIDVYYLHRDDPALPVGEIVDLVDELAASGAIRHLACSNWEADRIREADRYARAHGRRRFVANQVLWNVGCYRMRPTGIPGTVVFTRDMYELHRELGMSAIAYSAQAGGYFSKMAGSDPEAHRRAKDSLYQTKPNRALVETLRSVAAARNVSAAAVVLGYVLSQPFPSVAVVGCRTLEQLRSTLAAAGERLTTEELRLIDAHNGSGIEAAG